MSDAYAARSVRRAGAVEAIGFATAALTLATVSLFAVPAYAGDVGSDLALSPLEVGALTSALALSYTLVQVPSGVLGSAIGIDRAFSLGLAIFAVGFVGSAVVSSFPAMLALRALTGLGAGMLLPLASALAAWLAAEGDARGQGALGTGWGLGYVLSLFLLPIAFDAWRAAFLVLGLLAFAAAAYAFIRLPSARGGGARAALRAASTGLASPAPWLLGACLFGLTLANVGVGAWVTVFAQDAYGMSRAGAGLLASLIGFGLLPASISGALVARRIGAGAVVVSSCAAMAVAVALIAAPLGIVALAGGLLLLGWCSGFPFGVVLAMAVTTARGEARRAQGAMAGAINSIGFSAGIAAPVLVGFVRDATSFRVAFGVLVVGPLLALAATAFLFRRAAPTYDERGAPCTSRS